MFAFFVLAVLALLFVVAPARLRQTRRGGQKHREQAEANSRAWYEERLQAVEQDVLEEEDKTQLADELAAVLLAEYPPANGEVRSKDLTPTFHKPGSVLLFSGALLVAIALVVYSQIGSYGAAKIQGAQAIMALSPEDDSAELQRWQIVLSAWLADQPDDAPSWYLLGHAHLKLGEFGQAERAFAQAYGFAESDVLVKLYWLQSRYLSQQGAMDALSKQLAEEILTVDPNNQQVLEMLVLAAIAEGDAASAITMLNRTLNTVVQPDRVRATVDAIKALRASNTLLTNARALRIEVNIADGVMANPRGTVFVVARPVGGGMPYAVVRRPSWLVPFTVTLDDLVSMSPARPLSQADNVEVVVRLSATGTAEASADDWRWLSEPISVALADREQSSPFRQSLNAVLSPPD
jgi:cytochrome c-type biogenesis protein CcmH